MKLRDCKFCIVSGEDVKLANAEIRALIHTYDPEAYISSSGRLILTDSDEFDRVIARAAFLKFAGRVLASECIDDVDTSLLRKYSTFACRSLDMNNTKSVLNVNTLAANIKKKAPWLKVSLEHPEVTFLLILNERSSIIGMIEGKVKRRVMNKVFRHPSELEPKLCRAMLNLAMVKEGSLILDPFCGTGNILLEACNIGMNIIGCDISSKMCKGALANLKVNNFDSVIINCDACKLPFSSKGYTVVTNMPYGRAASTFNKDPKELVLDFIDEVKDKAKRCVIMCKKGDEPEGYDGYDLYVHKSLSRRLMII